MELLQLMYFCHAAKSENFSKTAKEFQVPPSDISQSIHRLEKELGVQLFDRSANRIKVNYRGKQFFENVSTALSLIDKAKETINDTDSISGEIRLLVETNRRIVTMAIESFSREHKDVSFFVNNSYNENVDNYDVIITDRPVAKQYYKSIPLVLEKFLLASRKDYSFVQNGGSTVPDLEKERFITMGEASGVYRVTNEICSRAGFVPNIVIQSDDPFYIRKYIEMGLGIAFVPAVSWSGMFSENIVLRDITDYQRSTCAYYDSNKYLSNAVREFLTVLIDSASS